MAHGTYLYVLSIRGGAGKKTTNVLACTAVVPGKKEKPSQVPYGRSRACHKIRFVA